MDKNKPIQYILGYCEFYKLKFKVTPDVLIPRPETELLVDEVLKFLKSHSDQQLSVLDVGTGSGCIAISIAKNYPNCKIIATEVSNKALEVAKQNAGFHRVGNQINFVESDLLESVILEGVSPMSKLSLRDRISNSSTEFTSSGVERLQHDKEHQGDSCPDIIVTNLPYIPDYRIPYLDSSVKDYEPHAALKGGSDGFDLYRKLFQQMQEKGIIPKLLVGEIDYTQDQIAQEEAKKFFPDSLVKVDLDLYHRQRILTIKFE